MGEITGISTGNFISTGGQNFICFSPPFTAISVSHSEGFYRRIQGIFCSASCGVSFGNEENPAYTG